MSNTGEAGGRFGRLGYTLAEYVPKRVESVMAQLDGKRVSPFVPRPNGLAMGMRWGVKAPSDYGNLSMMAQSLRRYADEDSDYKLSGREARDAVAALFYNGVSEAQPESMDLRELTAALTPLVREVQVAEVFAPEASRGLFGINWHGSSTSATLWASAIFRDADTDRDGRVTLAELTDMVERLICLADRDQDSALDEREIIEGLDMLAAPDGGLR